MKDPNIIMKRLEDIKAYENNPRKNDKAVDAVAASISDFGFKVPIIIDKDGVIVAGHTRAKAAKKLGIENVPCIIADDLTPEQVKAFRIADNKTAELAEWDEDLLVKELAELEEIDMEQFGFDSDFLDDDGEVKEDDFEEELPEVPKTKSGQIWQLGRHRLMIGDSTSAEDVKRLMGGELADLCVTDPPYNVDYDDKEQFLLDYRPNKRVKENKQTGIENDKKSDSEFEKFLTAAFNNLKANLREGGCFYIWRAPGRDSLHFLNALENAGLQLRQNLIWVKQHFVLGRQDYQWIHEPCSYGWKEGAGHYFIDDKTQTTVNDQTPNFDKMTKDEAIELLKKIYEQTSAIKENKPMRNVLHPTMKPVNLFARLIKNSSRKGEKVLDLFGGSGTTIIASEQLDRIAYVMEFDPKYADVIIARWEEFTGQKAELCK